MAAPQRVLNRRAAACVSIALVGAVLSALLRAPLDDGFPLSTYPMFATVRGTRLTEDYAIGITATGAARSLPPVVSGSSEVLQAAVVYEDAVHAGGRRLGPLCTAIAAEVAADPAFADITAVRIVEGTHDALALLEHGTRAVEHVRWGCAVAR